MSCAVPSWHETSFQIAGLVAKVRCNDHVFVEAFAQVFYAPAAPGGPPDVTYYVSVNRNVSPTRRHSIDVAAAEGKRRLLVTAFYPSLFTAIDHDVRRRLAAVLQSSCLVQGAVVALAGQVLLLAAGDETERGMVVKALVDRGCDYLGDGMVIFDRQSQRVVPFPRSISLRRTAHPVTSSRRSALPFRDRHRVTRYVMPPGQRLWSGSCPPAVDLIAFLELVAQGPAALAPVSKAQALARLMALVLSEPRQGMADFEFLAGLVERTATWEVAVYGLKATTDLILARLLRADLSAAVDLRS